MLTFVAVLSHFVLSTTPVFGQTTNVQVKVKPPSLAGLHYVFDASESMCGYLVGDSAKNPLLGQIKMAVSGKNPEIGNRIYLVKQTNKGSVDAKRDIVEAPANLQTLAEQIKSAGAKSAAACQPFNGVDSNIELVFSPNSPTQDADAVLLISDAQLVEKDREKFVQAFAAWMRDALANGGQPYAGVALVEAEFKGRYFPVSTADNKHPSNGYSLGMHNRPLLMFWLAKSDKHLAKIQEVVNSFAPVTLEKTKDAFTQQLLPSLALGAAAFKAKADFKPPLSAILSTKLKLEFQKFDKSREDIILNSCLHPLVTQDRVVLEADSKCRDGRPIFDGVSAIAVTLPSLPSSLFETNAKPPNDTTFNAVTFKLTSKSFGEQPFELRHTLMTDPKYKIDAGPYSVSTDSCAEAQSKKGAEEAEEACTAKLAAKTYQLDVLFGQLFDRQHQATSQLLAPLNAMKYVVEFRQKK